MIARTQIELVHPEQDETADDEHDADKHRRFKQHAFDEAVRQRADDGSGQEGNQNAEDEAPRAGIAGKIGQDFQKFCRIDGQDGQNGTKLDQNLEGFSCGFKTKKMADQQQMSGGGNRDKFGQAFDKTEKRGFQQIKTSMKSAP